MIEKYIEVVDEINSIPITMLKLANEKVCALLGLKPIGGERSIKEFRETINVYLFWDKFFEEDMKQLMCNNEYSKYI